MNFISKLLGFQDTSEQEEREKQLKRQKQMEEERQNRINAEHDTNPMLCTENVVWEKLDNGREWSYDLYCAECNKHLGRTYSVDKEGRIKFLYGGSGLHGRRGNYKKDNPPEVNKRIEELLLQKIPDAYEPHPEWAELEQAEKRERDAYFDKIARAKLAEQAAKPKCPNCQSTNIRPITQSKRFTSTAVWGLASDTIGKSMECLNCKFKW